MYEPQVRIEVSQGDVFADIPINYMVFPPDGTPAEPVLRRVPAIILNRDCDYDKSEWVIVAEVRSLSDVALNSQGNVRHYRTRNTFYLPAIENTLPESYVDFRRIDRVYKEWMVSRAGQRLASLSDDARLLLQFHIALFFGYDPDQPEE